MKISVVIPTHDRLNDLRDAIETVRRQDYPDWELVVFDNASADDIAGYIARLSDGRIRYARSNEFLPVTDSWNRAIDLATGDYVVFLGNDDGLAPQYFSKINAIIKDFHLPEVLYCALYQFLQPGVAPWEPQGYVADIKNGFFFVGRDKPFLLARNEAQRAVDGSIGLRRNFTFNIQAFALSREFLLRLGGDGPIFRSPFPDYYFANIAFAKARSIVVVPLPLSIAGVSKASFGFTLFNNLEEKGAEILNAKLAADSLYHDIERFLLPGPLYNTNYVVTMEHVARYARGFISRGVNYGRYRRLQIFASLNAGKGRVPRTREGKQLWSRLTTLEKLWTIAVSLSLRYSRLFGLESQIKDKVQRVLQLYGFDPVQVIVDRGSFSRLLQVFEAIQRGAFEIPSQLSADLEKKQYCHASRAPESY